MNTLGSVVYALTLPYVAVATTLLYFDLQARREVSAEVVEGRGAGAIAAAASVS